MCKPSLAREFGGKAIREQNLSEWKLGGYRDWVAQREALEVAGWAGRGRGGMGRRGSRAAHRHAGDLAGGPLCRGDAARRRSEGQEGWRLLREMCGDIVELRKGNHSAERLQIDRERLALEKEQGEKRMSEKLEELLQQPATKERLCGKRLSAEEQARRLREIFRLPGREKENGGITSQALAEIERAASEKITPVPTPALDSTGGSADGRVRHRKAAGPERRVSAVVRACYYCANPSESMLPFTVVA